MRPVCIVCKEHIWNPISPKTVIFHAINFLDIKRWEHFLEKMLNILNAHRRYTTERIEYLDGSIDLPICWGCMFDLAYEVLKEIDENAAEKFKKYANPYGL